MKYTFSFKEINYGSIEIEAARTPTRAEIVDAIMNGGAYFKDTDYEDIRLANTERPAPKLDRERDR